MKHHMNPGMLAVAFAGALLIFSCSGNKQESKETSSDSMSEMKSGATDTAPVTPFENVDPAVKSQINQFAAGYFALNKTLIEDNFDAAKNADQALSSTVEKFDMSALQGEQMDFYHSQAAILSGGLKAMTESADIEEARVGFISVSHGMYALVKAYQPNATELYYQFCPMANNGEGANWLSDTKEIINPYMGQRMLKCGKTEEVIAQAK